MFRTTVLPHTTKRSVVVMGTRGVYCEICNELLYIIQTHLGLQRVHLPAYYRDLVSNVAWPSQFARTHKQVRAAAPLLHLGSNF